MPDNWNYRASGAAITPLPEAAGTGPIADALAAYAHAARGAFAANTQRALRADLRIFAAWCTEAGRSSALPVATADAAAFVDAMAVTRRPATVARYIASLNHLHRAADLPQPGATEPVRLALRRMRRRLGTRQMQAAPLVWTQLARIVAGLGAGLPDLRDAALLLLAYDSMARRSEIAALDLGHLVIEADGTGRLLILRSKTDQEGRGDWRFLSAGTVARIARWTEAAGIVEGALFRPLGRAAKHPRLAGEDVARIVARRARSAGFTIRVSAHSTRIGATQDALAHNLDTAAIQQAGGWRSPSMVARYGEKLAPARSAAAKLAAIQGR
jgi:integrase